MDSQTAARVLGGELVYVDYKRGQWVGIIEIQKIEQAKSTKPRPFLN
jgi:hypothetical protein